jgi:lysophospholipase L1-like esterase
VCLDRHVPKHDVLNGALSGAMLKNVVREELDYLLEEMAGLQGVDVAASWKVLTLFIGANDVCVACHKFRKMDASEWERNLRITLDTIRERVPRVLVNVVELFNVSNIYEATETVPYCRAVHRGIFIECDCAFGPEAKHYR